MAAVLLPPDVPPAPLDERIEVPEGVCMRYLFARCKRGAACRFSHAVDRAAYARDPVPAPSRSMASSAASAKAAKAADGPRAWRSIDWLLKGESVQTQPYLREFAAAQWLQGLLENPGCASMWNVRGRSLRKELTEAFGVLHACRRALAKLDTGRPARDTARPAVIFDLCCGKGFASLVLALSMPESLVVAVDTDPSMDLSHFCGQPNLVFEALDVTAADAGARLEEIRLREAVARGFALDLPRVAVGMHLCGPLSPHAARIFCDLPAPAALVLAPCCLDKRKSRVKIKAKSLQVDPHRYWCLSLLLELPLDCRRELMVDDDVLSERNSFLLAARAA